MKCPFNFTFSFKVSISAITGNTLPRCRLRYSCRCSSCNRPEQFVFLLQGKPGMMRDIIAYQLFIRLGKILGDIQQSMQLAAWH